MSKEELSLVIPLAIGGITALVGLVLAIINTIKAYSEE